MSTEDSSPIEKTYNYAKSIPRELSWLSFNERVLQEAEDSATPLIERVRFLGIFSNNMDEFFRVRVADVRRRILLPKYASELSEDEQLMHDIQDRVVELNTRFDKAFDALKRELKKENIVLLEDAGQMSEEQAVWLKGYFRSEIKPLISPIIVSESLDLDASLSDDAFYLAVELIHEDKPTYAMVEVPTQETTRFIPLPLKQTRSKRKMNEYLMLDDALKYCLSDIFEGIFEYDSINAHSFKMTRDAELDLSDEIDQSLMDKMSKGLQRRLSAEPVRMVYESSMGENLLRFLQRRLGFTNIDSMISGGPYRNFRDFLKFPNAGRAALENKKLAPIPSRAFDKEWSALQAIANQDILLYYPYHSFEYFNEMLRQASFDPRVTHVTINIYRVAKNSKVIHALRDAARNGKKVTVFVELQARFDEQHNLELSQDLQQMGIRVAFGIPSLKVHSKLCLISRREKTVDKLYAHIGTGNFHEGNAKIYTDFSLFTARPEITKEVAQIFEFIEHSYRRYPFNHLVVSPLNARSKLSDLIQHEMDLAEQGKKAGITIKVNNVVDGPFQKQLCEASQAGVPIKMVIRGMCSMETQSPNANANIEVISVIDQYLEHARVFIFNNDGDPKVYITSADLMGRNLDNRVEVGVPIYDEKLKKVIIDIVNLQLKDNTKARMINRAQNNPYVPYRSGRKIRSQIAIHQYLSKMEASSE